jgi:hypothetical protein
MVAVKDPDLAFGVAPNIQKSLYLKMLQYPNNFFFASQTCTKGYKYAYPASSQLKEALQRHLC